MFRDPIEYEEGEPELTCDIEACEEHPRPGKIRVTIEVDVPVEAMTSEGWRFQRKELEELATALVSDELSRWTKDAYWSAEYIRD